MALIRLILGALLASAAWLANADEVSLRLAGKELRLEPGVERRLAGLARDMLRRCGPNTQRHPHNFGLAAIAVQRRWKEVAEGSRLRVRFAEPFVTESHLGGALGVSEAFIGLASAELFVGPNFTRHGDAIVEHAMRIPSGARNRLRARAAVAGALRRNLRQARA